MLKFSLCTYTHLNIFWCLIFLLFLINITGNKFTDGLDLKKINDWSAELRPSMRKLRQAMDGLLKTARLTHSVFRVQEDTKAAQRICNVRYRRDVCFSQAVSIFCLNHFVTYTVVVNYSDSSSADSSCDWVNDKTLVP